MAFTDEQLRFVVRVIRTSDDDDRSVGTGILVVPNAVITCAHIVLTKSEWDHHKKHRTLGDASIHDAAIKIEIPGLPEPVELSAEKAPQFHKAGQDLVLLTLDRNIEATPATFLAGFNEQTARRLEEHRLDIYGYRDGGKKMTSVEARGASISKEFSASGKNGLHSFGLLDRVVEGYSGGPVVISDAEKPLCIGMATLGGEGRMTMVAIGSDLIGSFVTDINELPTRTDASLLGHDMSPSTMRVIFLSDPENYYAIQSIALSLECLGGIKCLPSPFSLMQDFQWKAESELSLADVCIVVVAKSGIGSWMDDDIRAALERRIAETKSGLRVIPVLLKGATRPDRQSMPWFLATASWVESRLTDVASEVWSRTVGLFSNDSLLPSEISQTSPYPGLQAFTASNAEYFFGREAQIDWLLAKLRPDASNSPTRFLAIVGASGSGKSSLASAGLIPALQRGGLENSAHWRYLSFRPGNDPLESLAVAIVADSVLRDQFDGDVAQCMHKLESDTRQLHFMTRVGLHDHPASHQFILLIDQFEEVFAAYNDEVRRRAFIDSLMYAVSSPTSRVTVLITLRADFYEDCASYPQFAMAIADNQELVGPLTRQQLRSVIECPAAKAGVNFEPGLVELLLRDMQEQHAGLPILQHTLRQLWEHRKERRLTLQAYRGIGRLDGALERHAELLFNSFKQHEKDFCRRILMRLTQPADGRVATRRRVPLTELELSHGEKSVVDKLVVARILVIESSRQSQSDFIEVAHEALFFAWKRLARWVEENRYAILIQHRLSEAAREWKNGGKNEEDLYQGARLANALEWLKSFEGDISSLEKEFVDESVTARAKARSELQQNLETTVRLAHQIKVPITGLESAIELMSDGLRKGESPHEFLKAANAYTNQLTRLVRQFDLLRRAKSTISLRCQRVRLLRDVVRKVLSMLDYVALNHGFSTDRIRVEGFESIPPLFLDAELFREAFANLVENAIRYSRRDSARVELRAEKTPSSYNISVLDYGIGTDEVNEFKRGMRGKSARAEDATGQGNGLWIADRIVRQHGGDIQLVSARLPTHFMIRLPLHLAMREPPPIVEE